MKKLGGLWAVLTLVMFIASCAASAGAVTVGSLTISNAWARAAEAMPMDHGDAQSGGNGAAYLVIENKGSTPDRLLRVESDAAMQTEIHLSEMKDDVMKMAPVDGVDIPANGKVELKSGGYHIMMIGLKHDLKEGEKVRLKLTFETTGSVEIDAVVRAP